MRKKYVNGFKTGDLVLAVVRTGKKAGRYCGLVAVRASGSFNIQTRSVTVQGVSWKYRKLIQRDGGYALSLNHALPPFLKGGSPHGG